MNPAGLAYVSTVGVEQYGGYTGMLVCGRGNRNAPEFQEARKKGAEFLAYLRPPDIPQTMIGIDWEFYHNFETWPYPSQGARQHYYDAVARDYHYLADLRAGSPTSRWIVEYITYLIRDRSVDGVFLDVVGERPWSKKLAWDTWPADEKLEWINGNVDLVRQLRAVVNKINPGFIIMNNNSWGDGIGREGENYVNGRCIEHHAPNAYQLKQAQRPFGVPSKRRVLVLSKPEHLEAWKVATGPTHLCDDQGSYLRVTPPPVPFTDLSPPPP